MNLIKLRVAKRSLDPSRKIQELNIYAALIDTDRLEVLKEVAGFRLGHTVHESIWDAKHKSLFFVDIDSVYALRQENLEKMIKERKRW